LRLKKIIKEGVADGIRRLIGRIPLRPGSGGDSLPESTRARPEEEAPVVRSTRVQATATETEQTIAIARPRPTATGAAPAASGHVRKSDSGPVQSIHIRRTRSDGVHVEGEDYNGGMNSFNVAEGQAQGRATGTEVADSSTRSRRSAHELLDDAKDNSSTTTNEALRRRPSPATRGASEPEPVAPAVVAHARTATLPGVVQTLRA